MTRFIVFMAAMAFCIGLNAQKVAAPDFAYPKKVEARSEAELKNALKKEDGPAALKALMNYSLARVAVNPAAIDSVLAKVNSVKAELTDPVALSLIDLLQARMLLDVYNATSWKVNGRLLPLSPLPADVSEWSGDQFRAEISRLTDSALLNRSELEKSAVKDWSKVIVTDKLSQIYYPTVYDFVAVSTISYIEQLYGIGGVVPLQALSKPAGRVRLANVEAWRVLGLYDQLIKFHINQPAPQILQQIARMRFLADHLFGGITAQGYRELRANLSVLYDSRVRDTEFAGEALIALDSYPAGSSVESAKLLDDARFFIKKYPAYPRLNEIKNIVSRLSQPTMSIELPECFAPGKPVTISVNAANVKDGRIDIYKVSASGTRKEYVNFSTLSPSSKIGSLVVSVGDTIPCHGKLLLPFTFEKEGAYVLVPFASENDISRVARESYQLVWCTGLAMSTVNAAGQATVLTVEPETGAPVSSAEIFRFNDHGSQSSRLLGKTDSDGFFSMPSDINYATVFARLGESSTQSLWINNYRGSGSQEVTTGNVYTSLPLYHPGDSLQWSAVVMQIGDKSKKLLENQEATVVITDVNGQEVSKSSHVTDSWGRINGACELPASGLTGQYLVSVRVGERRVAVTSFTVSDYRLPTFTVETDGASTAPDGTVTLGGIIKTYSGFAMAGATVKVTVSALPWSRYWYNAPMATEFFRAEVSAASDGRFTVKVPAGTLNDSPAPEGPFRAVFDVTSPSGESRSANMVFSRKPLYLIYADVPAALDVNKPSTFNLKVTDTDNEVVKTRVSYTLSTLSDSIVDKGNFMSDAPRITFSEKLTGRYKLCFRVNEGGDSIVNTVVLYNPSSDISPVDDVIWSPAENTSVNLNLSGDSEILVGASSDTHILLTISDGEKLVERRWIDFPAGLRAVSLHMGAEAGEANVNLHAVSHYKAADINLKLVAPESLKNIVIKAESMRDRLSPGASETWTFSVSSTDGQPQESAVILGMYNASLDALQSMDWHFNSPRKSIGSVYWANTLGGTMSAYASGNIKMLNAPDLLTPAFQTYDRSFYGAFFGPRMYKTALLATSRSPMANDFDEAIPEAAVAAGANMDDAETVVKEKSADGGASSVNPAGGTKDAPFAYRDSEVALAFFRPMLVTDSDGRLTFSFTVPDANTTWRFNALAFTRSLLSASMQQNLVASKPVMVQPNLPRYLRQGDRAEISALVMNNSDVAQIVSTVIEIFDPVTGCILETGRSTDRLEPKASSTALITVDAPEGMPLLGYRVKSSTETFADGEQTAIPVLEAAQPLVVTDPFYIPAGEKVYTRTLPKTGNSARVILEFCENPAWYVVTALPGLASATPNTAPSAAGVLFSAAVADGIIRSNQAVAKALAQWSASDRSDSTLVSMLSQNADLKIALLKATPWMMDARSDTERMVRLSLLFDRKAVDSRISEAVSVLAKLQRGEGGWAWTADGNEADEWATMQVLGMLADLNRLGYMPSDRRLTDMTSAALKWIDAKVVENYRRAPGGNYSEYVFMRDRFQSPRQSSAAERVSSATVQQLLGRWKDLDAPGKAVAAIILDNHNYSATSRQILESLREYAETSPEKGMWWPSVEYGWWSMNPAATTGLILDAFAQCDPGCSDVDAIRQWLVLQKQTQMWGGTVSASHLVASFLAASGKWIAPAHGVEIRVGDELLEATPSDRTLGYVRADISSLHPSDARLTIAGEGATPSWGAVYVVDKASMSAIEPHAVPDLSIEKSMMVVGADGNVRDVSGKLAVGQKVRVTLVIKCGRAMDYVAVVDNRPACFEPVEQLPGYVWSEGTRFYRENSDAATSLFISRLATGTYMLTYDMWVNSAGVYTMGAATIQSQMAPALTANSAGAVLEVNP